MALFGVLIFIVLFLLDSFSRLNGGGVLVMSWLCYVFASALKLRVKYLVFSVA